MLKALGVAQPCLRINLEETSFFLRPSPDPEQIPSEDPIIRGTLVLNLPKPKRIKSIAVRVVAQINISFPDYSYEAGQSTVAEVTLQSSKDERLYDKGEHMFSFTLFVPSSSAPVERCSHGRIMHTVNAVVQGEGVTGSNVEAKVPIFLVANPAPEGETSGFNVRVEGFREELGPYAMATAAQHLTVGGLLEFDILLASVPTAIQIISVSATLLARYTLRSIQRPNAEPQHASKRTRLFIFDAKNPPCSDARVLALNGDGDATPTLTSDTLPPTSPVEESGTVLNSNGVPVGTTRKSTLNSAALVTETPLSIVEAGGSYQVTHIARLPNDDIIRPSTLNGTKTPIQTKHELTLEVRFAQLSPEGVPGKSLILRSEHPLILSSCCCLLSSLLVPAYSEALNTSPLELEQQAADSWNRCNERCICMSSREDLLAQYRAADQRLRSEHASTLMRERSGRMTTVVSWDNLSGPKYEYVPVVGSPQT